MQTNPRVYILPRSPRWRSALTYLSTYLSTHHFSEPIKILGALDIDDCFDELAHRPDSAAIVELTTDSVVQDCRQMRKGADSVPQARIFAVANDDLRPWLPLIRVSGFSGCWLSPSEATSIADCIERFFSTSTPTKDTLENHIQNNLPWRPCKLTPP